MDKNAENEDEQIPDTGVSKAAFQENDHRFAVIGTDLCFLKLPKCDNFMCSQEAEFLSGLMMSGSNARKICQAEVMLGANTLHLLFPSCSNIFSQCLNHLSSKVQKPRLKLSYF